MSLVPFCSGTPRILLFLTVFEHPMMRLTTAACCGVWLRLLLVLLLAEGCGFGRLAELLDDDEASAWSCFDEPAVWRCLKPGFSSNASMSFNN